MPSAQGHRPEDLTAGNLLVRNTGWNLLGQGLPLLVALVAMPILIKQLGTDRFGVLLISWAFIGYFSLFDLGLSRALTKLIADQLGAAREERVPSLAWTALALMAVLGLCGSLIVGFSSKWIVLSVLKIPEGLHSEALGAFYLLACSLPLVTVTAGFRGILEAYQRFGLINAARVAMGVVTFAGPLMVLPFTRSLVAVVAVLVAGRGIALIVHWLMCLHNVPNLRHEMRIDHREIRPLLAFGGWMTISNLISPMMAQMDRFLIGIIISVTAVTYYTTPYEIVSRISVIPTAAVGVLFPAIATSLAIDRNRTAVLFERAIIFVQLILFPIILIVVGLGREGLQLWLGDEFAVNSTLVLQILAVGILINNVAQVLFVTVQGVGRPDLTAKLHLAELPVYLLTLWILIGQFGIIGAAWAWTARVVLDMVLLSEMGKRLLPESSKAINRLRLQLLVILVLIVVCGLIPSLGQRVFYMFVLLLLSIPVGWRLVLTEDDRRAFRVRSQSMRRR